MHSLDFCVKARVLAYALVTAVNSAFSSFHFLLAMLAGEDGFRFSPVQYKSEIDKIHYSRK